MRVTRTPPPAAVLAANQVVSFRLREARHMRQLTQEEAAERLAPYLGVRWSEASFSAAEAGWRQSRRVRVFSANELVALARGFELPLLYFLVPPPGSRLTGCDVGRDGLDVDEMVGALFGASETVGVLEDTMSDWSAHDGRAHPGRPQLPPDLSARLASVASRLFGSPRQCADAADRLATLLRELEGVDA